MEKKEPLSFITTMPLIEGSYKGNVDTLDEPCATGTDINILWRGFGSALQKGNQMRLEFFVKGDPATQGSKKAFYIEKIKQAIVTEDCKRNKPWRSDVRNEAEMAMKLQNWALTDKAVSVSLMFYLKRPKGHFGAKGLKTSAPKFHTKKPDTVKLARAVEDALKNLVWGDDSQICMETIEKIYTEGQPGVLVAIQELPQ